MNKYDITDKNSNEQEELKSEKNPIKKMFKGWKKGKIEKKSADLD